MSSILSPGHFKLTELGSAIERWEEHVRSYERRRDAAGNRSQIPEEIKTGILQEMCPDVLKTHLFLNGTRLNTYVAVKGEITSYLEAKSAQQSSATPMDVGSLAKGAKGKGGKGSEVKSCVRGIWALVPGSWAPTSLLPDLVCETMALP